ncbi:MAG: thiamine phosphate synthase [Thermoleophilia bacterium]
MDLSLQALIDHERVPQAQLAGWLEAAARGGVTGVQLREKEGPTRESYAYGRSLARLARELGLWFSVDDRLDLALALEADVVHLGADDLPPDVVREIAPTLGLGLSARTLDELAWAQAFHPRYVGYGPVWPTASKADAAAPVGLAGLAAAVRQSDGPIVAIGGIAPSNVAAVWATGVAGLAVIAALTEVDDVEAAARSLLRGRP